MSTLPKSAQDQLKQLIEQIERLEQEKKAIADDIRDKYAEIKAVGYDTKAVREIVRLRKKSKTEREEHEGILAVYLHALGMAETNEPERPVGKSPELGAGYEGTPEELPPGADPYALAAGRVFLKDAPAPFGKSPHAGAPD